MNKTAPNAQTKFHEIKEAFEEIKQRQFYSGILHRKPHVTRRNETSYNNYRNRYTYTDTNRSRNASSFYNFRRDSAKAESNFRGSYEDDAYTRRPSRGTTHESLRMIRSRLRYMESLGLGLGIVLTGCTIAAAAFAGEFMWKRANRGKSFDELMRTLDENPEQKREVMRKRRRKPINREYTEGMETSEASTNNKD